MSSKLVIILHGYSDDARSFDSLASFLRQKGFATQPIYLGDYITFDDQITIADLAETFELQLAQMNIPREPGSFDLIVHSTGALVAREWLTRFYLEAGRPCPLDHFLMLAPANFGSPLGAVGKTMLGRIVKGWKTNFQSGTQVLTSLEMGSSYTRSLARRDVLNASSFYVPEVCKTVVLVGSHPYAEGLRKLVDKNGGDGTVYVATANLNCAFTQVNMGPAGGQPVIDAHVARDDIAFGVFPDRNHSSITTPSSGGADLGNMIVDFLQTDSVAAYDGFRQACAALTARTLPENASEDIYHRYMNLAPRALDNLGFPIRDYFVEFYERPETARQALEIDSLMVEVHSNIIEEVHAFSGDPSCRSLLFDLTDLKRLLVDTGKELMFSLSAAPLSPLIGYSCDQKNDVGEFPLEPDNSLFWRPNQTHLVDLIVSRRQGSETERAFQLKAFP